MIVTLTTLGGLKNLCNMKVTVIPLVIDTLGAVTIGLVPWLKDLEIRGRKETIQTKVLKIGQYTEKGPGDLRKLAVTQPLPRKHRLTLRWKTFKAVNYKW